MVDDYMYADFFGPESSAAASAIATAEVDEALASSLTTLTQVWTATVRTCATAHLALRRLSVLTREMLCASFTSTYRVHPFEQAAPAEKLTLRTVTTAPAAESDWGFFIGIDDEDHHTSDANKQPGKRRLFQPEIGRPLFR